MGSALLSTDHLRRTVYLTVWSLFLFFSMINVINLLHITYYPAMHRFSYEKTIHIVIFSESIDSVLFVILAAISSFLLILQKIKGRRWFVFAMLAILNISAVISIFEFGYSIAILAIGVSSCILICAQVRKDTITILGIVAIILCLIEVGSLLNWLLFPIDSPSYLNELFSRFSNIETQLFYAPADLTPIAMLLLLFSYPLFMIAKRLKGIKEDGIVNCDLHLDGRILLVAAIVLTAIIASYPYLPSINPEGKYVGTDIYYYKIWLDDMGTDPSNAVNFAIHHISSRPLFLLLLYYLRLCLRMPTVAFLEWIGVPIFCLLPASVYCFGSAAKGRNFAGLAALLSSFSINVVAGMYTAYYSNILALSLLYFALALLVIALKRKSYSFALMSCVPSILAIFVHPWTWTFLLVAICAFAGLRMLRTVRSHGKIVEAASEIGPVFVFIAANVVTDLLKTLLLTVPSATGISYELAGGAMSINEFFRLWFNLYFTFRFFAGGYFNSFTAIISAIAGTWWFARQEGHANEIILAWLSIGAIPTLFVNFWVNERIFYNLPIQMLSAAGLCFGLQRERSSYALMKVLSFLFVLINLNYALRSMVNLV